MRNILMTTLLAATCLALAGCATTGPESKSPTEYNSEYMAKVEHHAKRAGVNVVWVNPPRRPRVSEDDS